MKEYKSNKHTKFFTYAQLIDVSKKFPRYTEWDKQDINGIIEEIQVEYKISSIRHIKEDVINKKIKVSYFLASLIGMDIPFRNISTAKFISFYKFVVGLKDKIEKINSETNHSALYHSSRLLNDEFISYLESYSNKELIDILALIYTARDSEDDFSYNIIYEYVENQFNSRDEILRKIIEKKLNIEIYLKDVIKKFGKNNLWDL